MESNIDLMRQATDLSHRLIVLDLTLRTLEIDRQKLSVLKMHRPIVTWYEKQEKMIFEELKETKKQLYKFGGKLDLAAKVEEDVSIYTLLFRGKQTEYRYFNIALRNHVENELMSRLGLKD